MKTKILFLFILFFLLVGCTEKENSFDCKEGKDYFVSRVIDGDTIETIKGKKIRLLGINTPEKREFCFKEAKEFLEKEVLGKKVKIQGTKKDKYGRLLANVCIKGKSINKRLIEEGLAHYAFIDSIELKELQENAMKEKKGCLWREGKEKYIKEKCIKLKKLEFNQNAMTGEYIEFSNECSYPIDLNGFYLKDESTNIYFFPEFQLKEKSFVRVFSAKGKNKGNELYWNKGNVWNNDRDQAFLRNNKGILVVYFKYNNLN
jgi:micrococcal nuclease